MAKFISPLVPQWLLDELNRIDFKKTNSIVKKGIMTYIKNWADSNLTKLNPNKTYTKGTEAKVISKDFDTDLLDLINQYEYDSMPELYTNEVRAKLRSAIEQFLPIKETTK